MSCVQCKETENWAPLPWVFYNTIELGSMRHECETASVMSALAEIVIMSAHVTNRKTQDRQDETTRNYHKKIAQKLNQPVTCQYATTTDSKPVTNQRAEIN